MVINDEDGKQAALLVSRSAAVTGQKHNVVGSSPDTSVRVDFVKVQAVLLLGSPSEDYQCRMSAFRPAVLRRARCVVQSLSIKSRYFSVGAYWLKPVSRINGRGNSRSSPFDLGRAGNCGQTAVPSGGSRRV